MASTAFPEKGALALLDDLIAEMQANINSVGISNQLPQPPANASLTSDSIAPVAPENMEGGNDDKKKYEKKKGSGRPVKVEPNPPPKDVETVNALDFRVGVIRSVKKHETADKLYCEEIDIGEAEPRQIASGLVPHYTLEQMMGRRLIVVANLKPRKLQGFTSAGMVLCAATPDSSHPSGEKVEFIDPPNGSVPGDRVVGEGLMLYDALSPGQVEKQKTWEKIGSQLRVDSNGVATWNGIRLVVQSQADLGENNLCTSPTVRDAIIR